MNNLPTNIFVATEKDYPELSELWEASIRSTHHFLSEEDIQYYKPLVQNVYFPAVQLYIIKNKDNRISGFLGLSDDLIEMLFIHPDEQGKRIWQDIIRVCRKRTRVPQSGCQRTKRTGFPLLP